MIRSLVVEDEFSSRRILQHLLSEHGECHIAVSGHEALRVFKVALESEQPYQLVCLDIMLPKGDGHAVLRQLRTIERASGIESGRGARVIMTTGLSDSASVMGAFKAGCESYLVKPVDRGKLSVELRKLGLLRQIPA